MAAKMGDYGRAVRVSKAAAAALGLGVLGLLLSPLLLPPLVAFVAGAFARGRVVRNAGVMGGVGLAEWAMRLGVLGMFVGIVILIELPSRSGGPMSQRSICAANLRGMVQSMCVYAIDNEGSYPLVTYAPYSAALNDAHAGPAREKADDVMAAYFKAPFPQAGSIAASAWMLVLAGQVAPKGFICRSDPFAIAASGEPDAAGLYADNFASGRQLSYSFAYPWQADGKEGPWWKDTNDATLPIAADMAPIEGTGTPPRTLAAAAGASLAAAKARNSANHNGDGQNVAFADAHVEFFRNPDVGQDKDNIYTASAVPSAGPSSTGVPSSMAGPKLTPTTEPFDVVMYPIRDAGNGRM